jgi:hypothetical protein
MVGERVRIRRLDPGGGLPHVYMLEDYERTFERVKFLKLWTRHFSFIVA